MTESPNDINHTKVSPSGVGDYGCCPLKLVLDTDYPDPADFVDPFEPHKDFGTVCHYFSQYLLGCAPPDEPDDKTLRSARACPGVPSTPSAFDNRVMKCSQKAVDTLNRISPLEAGTHWVSEHQTADKTLLPWRTARKSGKVEGFGGSIDILRSDRAILWDFKFTGRLPEQIKTTYLWQLGSYHLCSGVRRTGILWVDRSGNNSCHLLIDWSDPRLQDLAARIRRFVEFTAMKNFRSIAWPIRGESCTFCKHKGARCPSWAVPEIKNDSYVDLISAEPNALDDLISLAGPGGDQPFPNLL